MEELKKIVLGEHPVYDIPLFDAYIDGGDDYYEVENGNYQMDVRGWTKWSINPLMDCDEYDDKDGRRFVDLFFLLENVITHTGVEVQCEEPSNGYSAWLNIGSNGVYKTDSRPYYDWAIDNREDVDKFFGYARKDKILDKESEKNIMEMVNNESYPFSVLLGGYEWDFSSPEEILEGKATAPIRKTAEILS